MLDTLIDLFATGGAGSIVGVAGGLLTKYEERKRQKIDNEHKEAMRDKDIEELKLEYAQQEKMADKKLELAEVEGAIEIDKKQLDAFAESMKDGGGHMDLAKSLMRPIITVYLLIATTFILRYLWKLVGGLEAIPAEQLMELFKYIIYQVVFLSVVSVTWWFAARPSSARNLPAIK